MCTSTVHIDWRFLNARSKIPIWLANVRVFSCSSLFSISRNLTLREGRAKRQLVCFCALLYRVMRCLPLLDGSCSSQSIVSHLLSFTYSLQKFSSLQEELVVFFSHSPNPVLLLLIVEHTQGEVHVKYIVLKVGSENTHFLWETCRKSQIIFQLLDPVLMLGDCLHEDLFSSAQLGFVLRLFLVVSPAGHEFHDFILTHCM